MRISVVFLVGLILSGCAAQPETAETIAAAPLESGVEPPKIVCKKEKPTGSNRPIEVCRQVAGAFDEEQTKRDMRVLQRQADQLRKPPPN
ncbi:MAG: hypothetical protein EX272_05445 [Chromatiales bacterium]|nr:MAG: hypothetical protein EX272_05445 [Chromatiales bacterium]